MEQDTRMLVMVALAALAGLALLLRYMRLLSTGYAVTAMMLFATSLAAQDTGVEVVNHVWIKPLQVQRAWLYLGAGLVLGSALLFHKRDVHVQAMPFQGVLLLVINIYAGFLEMYHLGWQEGLQRIGFAVCTIGSMLVVVPALIRAEGDCLKMVRALGASGAAWTGACLVQMVLDRSQMITPGQNRFTGLLGNPQATAVYISPMMTILTWLVLNETRRGLRLLWWASAAATFVLLVWTGSRTGGLMYLIGLTAILYARAGRAVLLLPVVALGVYGLMQLAEALGINIGVERITSTTDTRTGVWLILLEDALHAPLFGMGGERKGGVENSYLLGTVIYGPLMGMLIFIFALTSATQCFRLWASRHAMPPGAKRAAYLVIGFNGAYFAGAFFEWFILARNESTIVYMSVFSAMASRLLAMSRALWQEPRAMDWGGAPAEERYGEAVPEY